MTLIGSVVLVVGLLFAGCDSLPDDTVRHVSQSPEHVFTAVNRSPEVITHSESNTETTSEPEAAEQTGKVVAVLDGDTIGGKALRMVKQDTDRYGRTIADVYLPADVAYAGSNPAGVILPDMFLNRELVQRGLAWHYKQYSDDERLADDENRARAAKLGLWSDPRHGAWWEWRKLSKEERDKLR